MSLTKIYTVVLTILGLLMFIQCKKGGCTSKLMYSPDCEWYLKCLEDHYHCGPKGYPVGFGYKYCSRFL